MVWGLWGRKASSDFGCCKGSGRKSDSARNAILGFAFSLIACTLISMPSAVAKSFGELSCYKRLCWKVPSQELLSTRVGMHFVAEASWYDIPERDSYNRPGLTSSGEKFDPSALDRVSSPNLPNGTTVLLWSSESKIAAYAIVNNTGPFKGNRVFDLPIGLARAIGFVEQGLTELHVVIVEPPSMEEARYKKNRTYEFEGGILGNFETLHDAVDALSTPIAFDIPEDANPKPLNFGRVTRPAKSRRPLSRRAKHRQAPDIRPERTSRVTEARWQKAILEE
jgi:rare lipoprotein A (peptidoglycan hydrolase)